MFKMRPTEIYFVRQKYFAAHISLKMINGCLAEEENLVFFVLNDFSNQNQTVTVK